MIKPPLSLSVSFSWIHMTTFIVSYVGSSQRQLHTLRLHYGEHWHQQTVGYQDTWWEALIHPIKYKRKKKWSGRCCVLLLLWESSKEPQSYISVFLCTHLLYLFRTGIKCLLKKGGREKSFGPFWVTIKIIVFKSIIINPWTIRQILEK